MQMLNKIGTALVFLTPFAAQAAVDVKAITDVGTDVAAVGAAVFGIYVAIKAVKLVRRSL